MAALLPLLDVPAAWGLLAVCAAATVPVAVWGFVSGRFFEPLPLLAASCALFFVLRPLQLFIGWRDLYSAFSPSDPVDKLVLLDSAEMAFFVSDRLREPLDDAFARATGACALFLIALLVGYRLGFGAVLARRVAALRGPAGELNLTAAIAGSMAIGLAAQALIVARSDGPAETFENAAAQPALQQSFVLFVVGGLATAGLIVWAVWMRPRTPAAWAAFIVGVLAVCGFAVTIGSRSRVAVALLALAVIVHYLWRPWRRRELLVALVLALTFVSSFLVFRETADQRSLGEAAETAPRHLLDARVIVNDITSFDQVVYATTTYGRERDHENGGFLLDGARSFVPRAIDSDKPEGGDITLREAVWGGSFTGGRPPTAVGDLWIDFGFPGVAVGGLLIGLLARALLGLTAGPASGRGYRVALYAIGLVVLYTLVADTFSLALGYVFTLVLPFLVAVHLFGRLPERWLPARARLHS